MDPKAYIEAVASELCRTRGRGLLLSPADAALALSWHASGVPLGDVVAQIRRARWLRGPKARGAADVGLSLQLFAKDFSRRKGAPRQRRPPGISEQLLRAASAPKLAGRVGWQSLAERAEELLQLQDGGERYWSAAVEALRAALREMPRKAQLEAGADLRARLAPRPRGMPRRSYRRSLQLQLLSAASERFGVPPRAFLL